MNLEKRGILSGQEPEIECLLLVIMDGSSLRFFLSLRSVYCSGWEGGVMSPVRTSFVMTEPSYWLVLWLPGVNDLIVTIVRN